MRSWSGLLVHVTMGVAVVVAGAAMARAASDDPAIAQGQKLYARVLRVVSRRRRQGQHDGRCEGAGSDADRQAATAASFHSTRSC